MSNVLKDALNITKNYENIMSREDDVVWPAKDHDGCAAYLHMVPNETSNSVEHKMISNVWNALFYHTWMFYRKTYILDKDFFESLTKAKSVKIYPRLLKTLAFPTFAIDLSGSDIMNGYILCNFNITDEGIYCSFLANQIDGIENNKSFGIFLKTEDMDKDDHGESFFDLDKFSEENSDIAYFRKPTLRDKMSEIFKRNMPIWKEKYSNGHILRNGFLNEDYARLNDLDDKYFDDINALNNDEKWFVLKKALIQLAYYFCTPEPDVCQSHETTHELKRLERLNKPNKFVNFEYKYKVGSKIGARIKLGRTVLNDIGEKVEYTKGTIKCPHVRGAHWTHVWCGPKNEQHLEARFLEVTFVNYTLGNIDEVCNEVSDKVKQNWEGESLVIRALEGFGITPKPQHAVIINGHRYRFDVSLRINGQLMFIEYDGEQHFEPVSIYGGEEGFKRTREADAIKNEYCRNNNIPLLRIPYTEKGNISNLVGDFINLNK